MALEVLVEVPGRPKVLVEAMKEDLAVATRTQKVVALR